MDAVAAERTWDAVAQFASFGFCKAHAAAFAVPTYRSAWLKAHYPAHFLAGILTHDPGMYPRRALLDDARRHGIPILPLDVNVSEPEYTAEEVRGSGGLKKRAPRASVAPQGYGIRLALQDVHGISDAEIRSILIARAERPFTSVEDFLATDLGGQAGGGGARARRRVRRAPGEQPSRTSLHGDHRPRPHAKEISSGCRSTHPWRARPTIARDSTSPSATTPTPRSCARSSRSSGWTPPGTS